MRFKVSKPDGQAQYQGFYVTFTFFICKQKVLWKVEMLHCFHYLSAPSLNLAFTLTDLLFSRCSVGERHVRKVLFSFFFLSLSLF